MKHYISVHMLRILFFSFFPTKILPFNVHLSLIFLNHSVMGGFYPKEVSECPLTSRSSILLDLRLLYFLYISTWGKFLYNITKAKLTKIKGCKVGHVIQMGLNDQGVFFCFSDLSF